MGMSDFDKNVKEAGFRNEKPCDDFAIHLKQYHPGVPGFTVRYDYYVTFKGEEVLPKDYVVEADLEDVWVKVGRVCIPDHVRQSGKTLTLTAFYNKDSSYKATIQIKLRKYEKTLEDNFETYNTDLWSPMVYGAKTKMSITVPKENYVKDNHLCLTFEKLETPIVKNGTEYWYTDCGVSTKGKFNQKYGCFSARMKAPNLPTGVFTAFWLMPQGTYREEYFFKRTDTGDDFHGCSEIDIMEYFDHPDTKGSAHTDHYWSPNWKDEYGSTKSSLCEFYDVPGFKYGDYQEFACVWNEYGLYYYVNGELAKINTDIEPVEDVKSAYIKFTCYIGPEGSGAWYGEVKDKDLPQEFLVDWLKVYK